MPRKVRELIKELQGVGFECLGSAGKGSHRKFGHPKYPGAVTLSGKDGADSKHYQEKQIKKAIETVLR